MDLRLKFLQCEFPNHKLIAFIPSMIEYYNLFNYKPDEFIGALAKQYEKYGFSRNDIESILSKIAEEKAKEEQKAKLEATAKQDTNPQARK